MRSLERVNAVVAFVGVVALLGLNAYLKDATLRTLAPYS
jgi:type VI secretion system protein ImpK